jgi:S-DNA-T family DNA segregation ATPase FtsK/SpoIIIE
VSLAEIVYLFVALAVLALACRYGLGPFLILAAVRRDAALARSCWQAAAIRRRWRSLARALSLVLADKGHQGPLGSSPAAAPGRVTYRCPRLHVRPDSYGVTATLRTVAGVGLTEVEKHAQHLADAWGCVRVAVTQLCPGQVRIRAVRRDPLRLATRYQPDSAALADPGDLRLVPIGVDEYAAPAVLRLEGLSGLTVGGIAGSGKTSFLLGLVTRLAPSPAVALLLLDGKVDNPREEGDYADVVDRFSLALGDDLEAAADLLERLVEFRRTRSRSIRTVIGSTNIWHSGPSAAWPLVILIIDEAQSYFRLLKAGRTSADRDALVARCIAAVEDLVKKGRSVGIITILATQKPTGDAVPTAIRDNCGVSVCFAVKTMEAAKATLGDEIKDFPDCWPMRLVGPDYVGALVMAQEGKPGYLRVKTPYCSPLDAGAVALATSALVHQRGELPPVPSPAMLGSGDGE